MNRLVKYCALCFFLLPACHFSPSSVSYSDDLANSENKSLKIPLLTDFMIQDAKGAAKGKKNQAFSDPQSNVSLDWSEVPQNSNQKNIPNLRITDVQLTATGESIFGANASAEIKPVYSQENFVYLTIKGEFSKHSADMTLKKFLFRLAPPLIQQTFIGQEPKGRVLIDNSILLDIIDFSETEIKARFNTQGVPDFYLMGLHRLNVEYQDYFTDALIKFGEPTETTMSLTPNIDKVEVLRSEMGVPMHVKITGQNMMVYPKFSYGTLDGIFGFGYQTEVTPEGWETLIHIPNPETFDAVAEHEVAYATPFGIAFKEFSTQAGAQ